MFKRKDLLLKKIKKFKLTYSSFANGMNTEIDENLLPIKYAKKFFNFSVKSGALKSGMGFSALSLPKYYTSDEERLIPVVNPDEAILSIWHFPYYHEDSKIIRNSILFYTSTEQLFFFRTVWQFSSYYTLFNPTQYFSGKMNAIYYKLNGVDSMLIFVPEEQKIIIFPKTEIPQVITDTPNLVDICLHYERLFAILDGDRKTLMFSANLDPTNWDVELSEGGFIELADERGSINKIVSFNDFVYVFRDYGVTKISAYGEQEQFSVTQLFKSSSKIYGNSVACCGDRILFLARDGLHVFDGYSTSKIILNIESMFENINNENCFGVYFNSKYYLACKLNFNDDDQIGCENYSGGYVNNALIEFDIKTGDFNILRGVDILNMIAIEELNISKLVACFNGEFKNRFGQLDKSGKIFGNVLSKQWLSPLSNFGYPNQKKIVQEVLIKSKSNCKIIIKSNLEEKTYTIKGSEVTQRVKTNVRGELIQIKFICDEEGDVEISAPQIIFGVV